VREILWDGRDDLAKITREFLRDSVAGMDEVKYEYQWAYAGTLQTKLHEKYGYPPLQSPK
jgi:hypothetical protein